MTAVCHSPGGDTCLFLCGFSFLRKLRLTTLDSLVNYKYQSLMTPRGRWSAQCTTDYLVAGVFVTGGVLVSSFCLIGIRYLCYGSTVIINIYLFQCGQLFQTSVSDVHRRQLLTFQVDAHTERIKSEFTL